MLDPKRYGYQNLQQYLLQISLVVKGQGLIQYLDSGCSRHMMGERSMFLDLNPHEGGVATFGGISQGKISGVGKIGISSLASIDDLLYVKVLKYNQPSISQFCDSGYIISFNKNKCIVKTKDDKSFFTTIRHNNLDEIDVINLSQHNVTCMLSREDERWLSHKRLGHVNLQHISKLSKIIFD